MQVLVPISGRTPFFPADEYYFPKPLVEVGGQPMIELVIEHLQRNFADADFIFIVDREEARSFSLDRLLRLAAGENSIVVERIANTSGALCSCLLASDVLDPERELLIVNSDQIINTDLAKHIEYFNRVGADAGVLTFDSVHPRWSYVVDHGDQEVVQAHEKKVVSRNAIAGFYFYRRAGDFLEAAKSALLKDAHVGGVFYVSASLNELILLDRRVVHSRIDARDYHSFFSPERIAAFERSALAATLREPPKSSSDVSVIIPAAGEGSRFATAGWKRPKPFLDVAGKPMLTRVIENVTPTGASATVLLRNSHLESEVALARELQQAGINIRPVGQLTEGTACTVLLARHEFDTDSPMMVANADQLIDFDVNDFVQDCLSRGLDGSILVFRDPRKDPKWSFAKIDEQQMVTEVAEKKPISDLATVGVYLFTRGRDFVGAAADMLAANARVNGEFYTCPVYNYMIAKGAKIGVYEIPAGAMHGLGTPEDLCNYLKEIEAPPSVDGPE